LHDPDAPRRGVAKACLEQRHCERSEAIHLHLPLRGEMDCFVASLLAMTDSKIAGYICGKQKTAGK
jgi:hypothetical protein